MMIDYVINRRVFVAITSIEKHLTALLDMLYMRSGNSTVYHRFEYKPFAIENELSRRRYLILSTYLAIVYASQNPAQPPV